MDRQLEQILPLLIFSPNFKLKLRFKKNKESKEMKFSYRVRSVEGIATTKQSKDLFFAKLPSPRILVLQHLP